MAKPAGTISGGNGHYPGYSKNLPTTTGRSFSDRPWMDTERVRPRWCRQDMSEMWDAGLGPTQSIFRPTSPQPTGRKRRVGDRLASGPGIGMPVRNERALWGTRGSVPSSGQTAKTVSPSGVMCQMGSIRRWPSLVGHLKTTIVRGTVSRVSSLWTRFCNYKRTWRNFGPDMAVLEDSQLRFSPLAGLGLHRRQ